MKERLLKLEELMDDRQLARWAELGGSARGVMDLGREEIARARISAAEWTPFLDAYAWEVRTTVALDRLVAA